MTDETKLEKYYEKIHELNIYDSWHKRNNKTRNNLLREIIYKIVQTKEVLNNEYIDVEIKILLSMFENILNYEINIIDIIFILYDMDFITLKNFMRYLYIQSIKINEMDPTLLLQNNYSEKIQYFNQLQEYCEKDIKNSLMIINTLKKYCFPNKFIIY